MFTMGIYFLSSIPLIKKQNFHIIFIFIEKNLHTIILLVLRKKKKRKCNDSLYLSNDNGNELLLQINNENKLLFKKKYGNGFIFMR